MTISKNTYCGRCGRRGIKRETRNMRAMFRTDVVYSCMNPYCDRAEIICVSIKGDTFKNRKRKGEMIGNVFTVSKKQLDRTYYREK